MKRFWRISLMAALLLVIWTRSVPLPTPGSGPTAVYAQSEDESKAQTWFNAMSAEERVGQLFLVPFEGDTITPDSDIAHLILEYKIGGVILLAGNDNISGYGRPEDVPLQVAQLTNHLQQLAISGYLPPDDSDEDSRDDLSPPNAPAPVQQPVPLIIAINHEGDGPPNTHILSGLTEVPNNMAIGATWRPAYAQNVGQIVGRELTALGINMLLGPSLDVLERPIPFSTSTQGARSFGGDPYWVGLMGQAYITGVHIGSDSRIAVVPKHFPGNGSSDRPVYEEMPTVRKSLEQLKQIELAPFFAVTGNAANRIAMADALLTTHIRYQGFQGNIRATTAPVSFDPQALTTLMGLPEFAPWRQTGGVIVSDALGVRSVERFYDDTEQEFPHRRVAKDAFLAGNDLLNLADFALGEAPYAVQLENIQNTILWFQEKYETDPTFRQRVDEAVLRILQLKLHLYKNDFSLENVWVDEANISKTINQGNVEIVELAQSAVTLIAPSQAELIERIPSPPGINDKIVIFTDVRQVQQCSTCTSQPLIGQTALEERILALYGPDASEQVRATQIHSFSFADLNAFLAAGPGPISLPTPITITTTNELTSLLEVETTPTPPGPPPTPVPTPPPPPEYLIQEALRGTNWIIFTLLDSGGQSQILSRFLAQRPDIVRNAHVIVFAYNAPYYLDTTEISKLTAYYGIYSKIDTFIDASVRALFQELPLNGKSPVTIEGISYDLFRQTQPDPAQVIELYTANEESDPRPLPNAGPPSFAVGDTLHLQTGTILDRNGHPVPDGTLIRFIQLDRIQGLVSIIAEVPTSNGVARLDYVLEARTGPGQFRITAESGEAVTSQEVDITIEGESQVTVIIATLPPTRIPSPTPTSSPTPTPTSTPTPTVTPTPLPRPPVPQEPGIRIDLSELQMLVSMIMGLAFIGSVSLITSRYQQAPLKQYIGRPLWGIAGSLLVYNYYALGLPGTELLAVLGSWAGLLTTLIGGSSGLALYYWRHRPTP